MLSDALGTKINRAAVGARSGNIALIDLGMLGGEYIRLRCEKNATLVQKSTNRLDWEILG